MLLHSIVESCTSNVDPIVGYALLWFLDYVFISLQKGIMGQP